MSDKDYGNLGPQTGLEPQTQQSMNSTGKRDVTLEGGTKYPVEAQEKFLHIMRWAAGENQIRELPGPDPKFNHRLGGHVALTVFPFPTGIRSAESR
jgi:hypothetical protein